MSKQDILNPEQVWFDFACNTQDEIFQAIAKQAKILGLLKQNSSEQTLVNSFKLREAEGTTAFGDSVAIPHARNEDIIKPGIFIVRFKQPVAWNALDEKPVKVIIALIVPLKAAATQHLTILAQVAQKLAQSEFQQILLNANDKNMIIKALDINSNNDNKLVAKQTPTINSSSSKNIVAITACPVGVAHTYIAQDKLELAAKNLGHNIKVETHGSIGVKGNLTTQDIANADLVILAVAAGAADLGLERFAGKLLYKVAISKVISNPEASIKTAFADAKPFQTHNNSPKNDSSKTVNMFATDKKGIMKHIMAGVGYMVPFVVFGGIMIAIATGLTQAIYGTTVKPDSLRPNFLYFMFEVGSASFTLMVPILAGYIASSIAGRAALVPAMVSAFIANTIAIGTNSDGTIIMSTIVYPIAGLTTTTPAGFLGALLIGPSAGYLVKWMISWKVPKTIAPIMPIFVIPILATFLISFVFIYAVGAPIGYIMEQLKIGLTKLPTPAMAAIGLLLGAMIGFDMGGPINKVAFLTASGLIGTGTDPNTQIFMGAVAAAIPVAPIGMGLTTLVFRKFFSESERALGLTAMLMGCIGISEGAIPFAVRDPKRAIISNIIGSAVAGCIAGAFFLTDSAAHGGPIVAVLGAVGSIQYSKAIGITLFFLAIIAGAVVTCLIYGGLLTIKNRNLKILKIISTKFINYFKKQPTTSTNNKNKI